MTLLPGFPPPLLLLLVRKAQLSYQGQHQNTPNLLFFCLGRFYPNLTSDCCILACCRFAWHAMQAEAVASDLLVNVALQHG